MPDITHPQLPRQRGGGAPLTHDLRRTVGTELARMGLPVHIRSLVLNHSPMSRGITDAVYNRYAYDPEKRAALKAWEARLSFIVGAPLSA